MKYIAAEVCGLGAETAASRLKNPNDARDMFGAPIDPGSDIKVGQWMSAQDGMVYGAFSAKREAVKSDEEEDFSYEGGRAGIGSGPVYVGKVVKVHRRYQGCGTATQVILAVA